MLRERAGAQRSRCGRYQAQALRARLPVSGPDGAAVRDPGTVARIRSLAIPLAWQDVWICTDPAGHSQATGTDAAGRRQYRYHDLWRKRRDQEKHVPSQTSQDRLRGGDHAKTRGGHCGDLAVGQRRQMQVRGSRASAEASPDVPGSSERAVSTTATGNAVT
jgi:DNA topoisomerase IB-like protein